MTPNIFLDPACAGVFFLPAEHWEAASTAASRAQRQTEVIRLAGADKDAVLRELGRSLGFPDWYGANFDALYDCLTDPGWHPAAGQVLLISGLDNLKNSDPDSFAVLIDVFLAAADALRDAERPFWILIGTLIPDLPPLPIQ